MSLVSSINIANQALLVNQSAITAVSNNISNVDTEGYSKLNVHLASVVNYTPSAGNALSIANSLSGVELSKVERSTSSYLQNYYWQENSTDSYLSKYTTIATNVENLTNELNTTGLSTALSNFYTAANALNQNPSDITVRQNFISVAESVCSVFNSISKNLSDLRTSLVGNTTNSTTLDSSEVAGNVQNVNNLLDQIASINYNIIKTNSKNTSSSVLLDQRDKLIGELSSLIPTTVTQNSNGTVDISLGDYSLLKSSTISGYLDATTGDTSNPAIINIVDKNNTTISSNINSAITGGKIGAILDACGSDSTKFTISGVLSDLNTLASQFASAFNEIQTGDPAGDGTTAMCMDSSSKTLIPATQDIFTTKDGSATLTAGNIGVNSTVKNNAYLIAAARIDTMTTPSYANATGNNSNTTLILAARNATYNALGSVTMETYLASTVSKVGTDVKSLNNNLTSQDAVLAEVKTQLSSATGVNLDQELVDLIKYQRSYQAAARVFTVCSDLMGELINLGK